MFRKRRQKRDQIKQLEGQVEKLLLAHDLNGQALDACRQERDRLRDERNRYAQDAVDWEGNAHAAEGEVERLRNELVDCWYQSKIEQRPLHEVLRMTWDEYRLWNDRRNERPVRPTEASS